MNLDIRTNADKTRLYLVVEGFFTDEQVREATSRLKEVIDEMPPGFDMITDISSFKPASPEGAKEIAQIQGYLVEHGINRAIRVVGEAVIGRMQVERTGKEAHLEGTFVASIEEAEKMLDAESAG